MSKRKGGPGQEPVQAHAPAAAPADSKRLLHRTTLRELVKQTLGGDGVSPAVEELLLDVGDDFLEHVAAGAAALARHRGGNTLEAEDVRLHCERVWGLPLPGHGADTVQAGALSGEASGCVAPPAACHLVCAASHSLGGYRAHTARLAAIRRTVLSASQAPGTLQKGPGAAPGKG